MKNLLTIICLLLSLVVCGQENEVNAISFSLIDEIPVYPGCEKKIGNNRKKCFNQSIRKHIARNFNSKIAQRIGLKGGRCTAYKTNKYGERECVKSLPKKYFIYVQFVIDENGEINNIKAKAPHPKLKEEAIRVVKRIPKLTSGKQNGKPVSVGYMLPITFNVE